MISIILMLSLAAFATEPFELADGTTIAVRTYGDAESGPSVVLVPGLTGCAYGYRHLSAGLVDRGCRVLVIEPLGIGASDRPADADYSLTAQADRLAAVMTRLRPEPSVVVAHGVAASMALRLAYRRPDLVAGVFSIEGGPDENGLTPTVERTLDLVSLAVKLRARRLVRDRFRAGLEAASGDASWIDDITVRRYYQGMGRDLAGSVEALRAMAATVEPEPLRDNLERIACPVTLLLGTADHAGRPEDAAVDTMRRLIPDFSVAVAPGAGHYIFEEQPDLVTEAVVDLASRTKSYRGAGTTEVASCAR